MPIKLLMQNFLKIGIILFIVVSSEVGFSQDKTVSVEDEKAASSFTGRWNFTASTEHSNVDIGSRHEKWVTNKIQSTYKDNSFGGGFISGESQKRSNVTDVLFSAGGYKRLDKWTVGLTATRGVNTDFTYRYSVEPRISRVLFGSVELQGGYTYRSFSSSRLHIGNLGATKYFSDGELELRWIYGNNVPSNRPIRGVSIRALWDDGSALSFGGGVTTGKNLYDVINVQGVNGNRSWIANLNMRYRIKQADIIRVDVFVGKEEPTFRQEGLGISYTKAF